MDAANSRTWNSEPGGGCTREHHSKTVVVVGNTATMNITASGDYKNGADYTFTVVPLTVTAH
jgi:hypothetical protein